MSDLTIGQGLIYMLAVVWGLSVIWWGLDAAMTRYQRRLVRTTRPMVPVLDGERGRQLHAIVKGTDRLHAGYQQGHDYYGGQR